MEITVEDEELRNCPVCGKDYPDQPTLWHIRGTWMVCKHCHDELVELDRMTNGLHEDR